ncbi:DUF7453 family protein [Coleofasciculus sp. F4-SAH-05]|uniref:DUF7453 family protein n=1 Tax=Coleofasciculus sp. F4-SAH-05 TaxID=3069525 RepID=UPI0032F4DF0D
MKHPTIYRLSMATVGMTLSLLAMGDADAYTFSRIFDDSGPYNFDSYPSPSPAINNQGTVAFKATLDLDQYPFPSQPRDSLFRDVIFTGDGQSLKRITQGMGTFEFKDINDSNTVAFSTQTSSPRAPVYVLSTTNGGVLTTISVDNSTVGLGADTFGDVAVNNAGNVVFRDINVVFRDIFFDIVTSDGVNRTTIADDSGLFRNFGEGLAINNQGTVAFKAFLYAGVSGIFTVNGDLTTPIADTHFDPFSNFGTLSLNDADTLAFAASLDNGTEGIFTSNGGSFTTIADTSGGFSSFSGLVNAATINNNGTVAFGAQLDTGEYGIFTGSDPVSDKVITIGDPLFGSTVTSLGFSNQGFNDAGQVAFLAQLADGSSGIFLADPDPNAVVLDWGGTLTQPIPATLKPIEIDDFSGQETLIEYDSGCSDSSGFMPPPICISEGVIHIGFLDEAILNPDIQTNNITSPDIRLNGLTGFSDGKLSLIFPEPQNRLGFGFALNPYPDFWAGTTTTLVKNAVSVKLFDASENLLGTLSGDAKVDPLFLFPDEFFGIESTVPFLRAEINFEQGSDVVFDNLRYEFVTLPEPATVPEPATGLGLLVISTIGAGSLLRHKQK